MLTYPLPFSYLERSDGWADIFLSYSLPVAWQWVEAQFPGPQRRIRTPPTALLSRDEVESFEGGNSVEGHVFDFWCLSIFRDDVFLLV